LPTQRSTHSRIVNESFDSCRQITRRKEKKGKVTLPLLQKGGGKGHVCAVSGARSGMERESLSRSRTRKDSAAWRHCRSHLGGKGEGKRKSLVQSNYVGVLQKAAWEACLGGNARAALSLGSKLGQVWQGVGRLFRALARAGGEERIMPGYFDRWNEPKKGGRRSKVP